jgi:hypothetical protein
MAIGASTGEPVCSLWERLSAPIVAAGEPLPQEKWQLARKLSIRDWPEST